MNYTAEIIENNTDKNRDARAFLAENGKSKITTKQKDLQNEKISSESFFQPETYEEAVVVNQ